MSQQVWSGSIDMSQLSTPCFDSPDSSWSPSYSAADLKTKSVDVGLTLKATEVNLTFWVKVMYGVCFALSGIAVAFSMVVFFAIIRRVRKRSTYITLILNLCAADCVVSISTVGFYTMQYLRLDLQDQLGDAKSAEENTFVDNAYCSQYFFEGFFTVAFHVNLFTIVTMAVYHVIALRWPHWTSGHASAAVANPCNGCGGGRSGALLLLLPSWMLALALGFLQVFFVATSYHSSGDNCRSWTTRFCCQLKVYVRTTHEQNQRLHRRVAHSALAAVTGLALVVVVCAYAYLLARSWARWRRGHSSSSAATAAAAAPSERAWTRLTATTAMLVGAFLLFWTPHLAYVSLHGLRLIPNLSAVLGKERLHLLKLALHCLACLCGVVDPFIYGLRVPQVRAAVFNRASRVVDGSSGTPLMKPSPRRRQA